MVAVRWYLRYGLSYRDVEELLAERGIAVDHVTVYRWVQRFTRCSSTRPNPVGTPQAIAGSLTKRCATRRGVTERG
jgi:transposase